MIKNGLSKFLIVALFTSGSTIASTGVFTENNYSGVEIQANYFIDPIYELNGYYPSISNNDQASSVDIQGNRCTLLAKDYNFEGSWKFISSDTADLATINFNNKTSSFAIFSTSEMGCSESAVGILYKNGNGGGVKYPILGLGTNIPRLDNFDNKASSYKLPNGTCTTFYRDPNFTGNSFTAWGDGQIHNMPDGWNDTISSFMTFSC